MTETCIVDECTKDRYQGRMMCGSHFMRQYRYGDPLHVAYVPRKDLTGERFGALVVGEYAHKRLSEGVSGWRCICDCGATAFVRTGDLNSGSIRSCGNVLHQLEDTAEYGAAHDRVTKLNGPAKNHACIDCGGQAAHWSYDHADDDERRSETIKGAPAYSLSPDHYEARCIPCHKRFDLSIAA